MYACHCGTWRRYEGERMDAPHRNHKMLRGELVNGRRSTHSSHLLLKKSWFRPVVEAKQTMTLPILTSPSGSSTV